eukprot:403342004
MYQICTVTNEFFDAAVQASIPLVNNIKAQDVLQIPQQENLEEQKEITSNFYVNFIPQNQQKDESGNPLIVGKVIIVEQQDGNNNLDLIIFEPETRESQVIITTSSARKWFKEDIQPQNQMFQIQKQKQLNPELIKHLDQIYDLMTNNNANQTLWIQQTDNPQNVDLLVCKVGQHPTLINVEKSKNKKFQFTQESQKFKWNPLQTFKVSNLSNQERQALVRINNFTQVLELDKSSFEYKYVAYKFCKTFNARDPNLTSIDQTANFVFSQPNKPQQAQQVQPIDVSRIVSIKKIFNESVYQIVESELNRLLVKHPDHAPLDLMNHLFHGTRQNDPQSIFSFENGLDMRYCNGGAHGIGIYFADNSQYSNSYKFQNAAGQSEMFMCLVLTGLSSSQGGGGAARQPPPIPGRQGELFDSYNNGNGGHFIIYDNQKAYPGYLITYT